MALVLMLVLRGLLGDAMAMGMVQTMPSHDAMPTAHATMTQHDHEQPSASADHCGDAKTMQSCGSSQHHDTGCSACDICNSSLLASTVPVLASLSSPQTQPLAPGQRFVSALPAQVVKPPIS